MNIIDQDATNQHVTEDVTNQHVTNRDVAIDVEKDAKDQELYKKFIGIKLFNNNKEGNKISFKFFLKLYEKKIKRNRIYFFNIKNNGYFISKGAIKRQREFLNYRMYKKFKKFYKLHFKYKHKK